jgi:hypothetical protein
MLQLLSKEIAECYRRAGDARDRAERECDIIVKQDFLDMEQRWLSLAHSYEFTERLLNFTDQPRKKLPTRDRVACVAGCACHSGDTSAVCNADEPARGRSR